MNSQAASISAWCTVLLWPSMVAALMMGRQRVASRSAARWNTARRSSHGQLLHSFHASMAASMACLTSAGPALW